MSIRHISVLRLGRTYESRDSTELTHVRTGEPAAAATQANAGLIRRDPRRLPQSREALRAIPSPRLLEICSRAGRLFMEEALPLGAGGATQSPEEYIESLSATSGLPYTLC